MIQNAQRPIKTLLRALKLNFRRQTRSLKISVAALFLSVLIVGFLGVQLFETFFYLSATVKMAVLTIVIMAAQLSAFLLYRRKEHSTLQEFTSAFIESRSGDGEQISNLIDLYSNPEQKSSKFYDAAIQRNLDSIDVDDVVHQINSFTKQSRTTSLRNYTSLLLITTAGILGVSGFTNTDSLQRTANFWTDFEEPNPYSYTIDPGTVTLEQGQEFTPTIRFDGDQAPENIHFTFKTDVEENYRERPMNVLEEYDFISQPIELTNSINYYIEMDGFKSESHRIDVQVPPRFDELRATVTPPTYTGLSEESYEYPFSDIKFYKGSEISIEGQTNKSIASMKVHSGDENSAIEPEGNPTFSHTITPQESDTLRFEMTDEDGLTNRNPFRIVTRMAEDEAPIVVIREPSGDLQKAAPSELDIIYRATDDFGITAAELVWEKQRAFTDQIETETIQLETPENGRNARIEWDLSDMELRPRDRLEFYVRARDNDAVSGEKWGSSSRISITVPSLADSFEELDSQERDVQGELDNISDSFEQMEQEYERFLDRLRQNPDGGFEEQEMLENVTEQQREIDEAVKEMKDQFDQLKSEMDGNDQVSDETRESYRELQQLMDELDDPELQRALDELRKAMENMSPDQMEQALENVSFNEQLYKERLERTKELFKQMKMNSDLDKLATQYADLSERLQSDPDKALEQLEQEYESFRDDMDRLSEQVERMDENVPSRSEEAIKQMKEETQQRLDEMKEQMDQLSDDASGRMEDGETAPTDEMQQQQQQLSEQMQEESDKIRNSMQEMGGQQLQVNILALQRSLYTLLELSENQEYITQAAGETRDRNQGFVDLARQQNYIQRQFTAVADSIYEVSAEIPGVPNRINRKKAEVERSIDRAISEMGERNRRGATITTRESLGGINDLSSTLASLIEQLMDQDGNGGGGGMSMEQMVENMQKMSGEQQELNQQLQDMVNDMQGDRLSREETERLDQMAQQQNEIRNQLRELQQSGALRDGDQTLSQLERMIEEMEDSINDMRGGVTDPIMIDRQQNILSRMLSAEEAMDQRGEEEDEWEGTRPDPIASEFPPDMTLEELEQEVRSRLQDPNYTPFSDENRQLIQRYFENLRQFDDQMLP